MNTPSLLPRVVSLCLFFSGLVTAASLSAQVAARAIREDTKAVPYRITRGDVLAVSVFDEPMCTVGDKRVESRGIINLPLIQEIRVVGLTIIEAQAAIESAYRDQRYLRNPQVTITVQQYAPRSVSVMGKVNQPGKQLLQPEKLTTLREVIVNAGGFSDTAKGTAVKVTRTLPDGSPKVFDGLDIDSVIKGKKNATSADAEFIIEPDDIVYVPERII